jgi:hypothetical protein
MERRPRSRVRRGGAFARGGNRGPAAGDAGNIGAAFTVRLSGFPARARRGGEFSGVLTLAVGEDAEGGVRAARVESYVRTPLGCTVMSSRVCDVRPGELRVSRMTYSLDDAAVLGSFTFGVRVTIDGEAVEVEHEVEVCSDR